VSNNSNGINHKKLTRHHIIPRSRGGGNGENVVEIPTHQHECWHAFFGNLNPIEAIEFIEIVFLGKGRRKKKEVDPGGSLQTSNKNARKNFKEKTKRSPENYNLTARIKFTPVITLKAYL